MNKQKAMNVLINTVKTVIAISGVLLIAGSMVDFEKRVPNWSIYRIVLMVICAIGYISFLIYSYKSGNKKMLGEAVIYGTLILLSSLIFIFFS